MSQMPDLYQMDAETRIRMRVKSQYMQSTRGQLDIGDEIKS